MNTIISPPETPIVPVVLDSEDLYEVINGIRVESLPTGAFQSTLAFYLFELLAPFTRKNNLGRMVIEILFQLDAKGKLQRRPDLAFVSYKRWPKNRRVPNTNAWTVIPDLAIEAVSPSNTAEEINQKIQDYFQSGVLSVWVIYPTSEQIYVFSAADKNVILTKRDHLECPDILPGLRMPVTEIFEDAAEEPAATPS